MKQNSKRTTKKLKVVVLAAGIGSRLNEVTRHIPKTMIKINGEYVFETILRAINDVGIKDVIFVVGYKRKQLAPLIKRRCSDLNIKVTFVTNPLYHETNTMYSLWLAKNHLLCPFVYIHGDLLFGNKMLKEFIGSRAGNSILVDKNFPLDWDDAMKIISHKGEIKYTSKSVTINEMDGTAVGIYKFNTSGSKKLFEIIDDLINKNVKKSWVSEAINILAKHIKVKTVYNNGNAWVDIDNLNDLNFAKETLKKIKVK